MKKLEDYVISIPDFPKPGIIFRDVTSVVQDADGLQMAIDALMEKLDGLEFDVIAGSESRGFVFGMPLAYNLHKPFVMIRKKGKLPRETVSVSYELEYGTASLRFIKMRFCGAESGSDRRSDCHRRYLQSDDPTGGKPWRQCGDESFPDGTGRTERPETARRIQRGFCNSL